jgi:hypothetical protein
MLLKPWSRSAVLRGSKTGKKLHLLKASIRILHVRESERWTEGPGARHAHIILRLHVGARRQQRPNRLQVAVLRGEVERRPSVLRRRPASRSAPPSAVLPRPSSLPTSPHAECRAQARSLPPSFHPPPQAPRCPRAPPPPRPSTAAAAPTQRRRRLPPTRVRTRLRLSARARDDSLQPAVPL